MRSRICLDMYILSILMLGAVALGFGIHELTSMSNDSCVPCRDARALHLNSMSVHNG